MTRISHKDVFLSYTTVDKESYVRPFVKDLDLRGISYWLDEAEILWEDKISTKINKELKLSDFVEAFLSDGFVGRNWAEVEQALALNRENSEGLSIVLPIIIDGSEPV